jgi:hypothetical protein
MGPYLKTDSDEFRGGGGFFETYDVEDLPSFMSLRNNVQWYQFPFQRSLAHDPQINLFTQSL